MPLVVIEYALLVFSAASMLWAGYALTRKRLLRTYEYSLLLFLVGVFCWSVFLLATLATEGFLVAHFAFMSAPLGLIGLTAFSLTFPEQPLKKRYLFLFLPTSIAFLLALIPGLLISDLHVHESGYLVIERGVFHKLFSIFISLGGILPTIILLVRMRTSFNPLLRQKFFWFIAVMTFTIIASIFTNVILPNFFHFPMLNSAGPIFSTSMAIIIVLLVLQEYYVNIRLAIASLFFRILPTSIGLPLSYYAFQYFHHRTYDIVSASIIAFAFFVFCFSFGSTIIHLLRRPKILAPRTQEQDFIPKDIIYQLSISATYKGIEQVVSSVVKEYISLEHITLFTAATCPHHIGDHIAKLANIRTQVPHCPAVYTQETIAYGIPDNEIEHKKVAYEALHEIGAEILIPIMYKNHVIGILAGQLGNKRRLYTHKDIHFLVSLASTVSPFLIKIGAIEELQKENGSLSSQIEEFQARDIQLKEIRKIHVSAYISKFRDYLLLLSSQKSEKSIVEEHILHQSKEVIRGLIDLVRVQSARIERDNSFELVPIFEEIIHNYRERVTFNGKDTDTLIFGSSMLLKKAFFEIIKNATEHPCDNEDTSVWITTEKNGSSLYIQIEDNGIGIPETHWPLLGTPLLDIHQEKNTKGVGLAIAHHVIHAHNGKITYSKSQYGGLSVQILFT